MSKIEWTQKTWNPIVGCAKLTDGCAHCYAEKMAARLAAMARAQIADGKTPSPALDRYRRVVDANGHWNGRTTEPTQDLLETPFTRAKPTTYFVCSMGDLFHDSVQLPDIRAVFEIIAATPRHTYIILTKRPSRMASIIYLLRQLNIPTSNVHFGFTAENQQTYNNRIGAAPKCDKFIFLSLEPLLGPVELKIHPGYLDGVIVGGESGPHARPMHSEWVRGIRDQCRELEIPFFFKKWGDNPPEEAYHQPGGLINADMTQPHGGRILDGQIHNETPWHQPPED